MAAASTPGSHGLWDRFIESVEDGTLCRAPSPIPAQVCGVLAPLLPVRALTEWSGDSSTWPQDKKLRSLDAATREKVQAVLAAVSAKGFKPKIFYAWRSVAVQKELHKKGRTTVLFSFHNAQRPNGRPNAYAADIIDSRWGWTDEAETRGFWTALGDAAAAAGLVWGGSWKTFRDVAHVQNRQNSELAAVKRESGL